MEEIVNLISTLGFPIAVAVAAFFFYTQFVKEQMAACAKREEALLAESRSREDKLTAQLDKFSNSLNNFNITLTKIDTRLEFLEKQGKGEVNPNL